MRKLFGLLVAVLFVACASSAVYAMGVGSSTVTARIAFTGAGSFDWNILIKNVSNNATATEITWTTVTPGVTGWKNADQYVMVNSTITSTTGKIRVYSNNKSGTAFKYTGTATENLGGLIGTANPTSSPLSMSWTMRSSTDTAGVPTLNPEDKSPTTGFNSSYFLDKSNSDFDKVEGIVDNITYSTILDAGGIKFGPGPENRGGSGSGSNYMFMGANFSSAVTPNTYGCDTIIFQGINE